jgi:hypothetical protein
MAALAACSSTPPPDAALANADLAMTQAEAAQASVHAPAELIRARQKLDQSKQAVAAEEYDLARRLAEESQIDSQLALAKSRAASAHTSTEQMSTTLDALREDTMPVAPAAGPTPVTGTAP